MKVMPSAITESMISRVRQQDGEPHEQRHHTGQADEFDGLQPV